MPEDVRAVRQAEEASWAEVVNTPHRAATAERRGRPDHSADRHSPPGGDGRAAQISRDDVRQIVEVLPLRGAEPQPVNAGRSSEYVGALGGPEPERVERRRRKPGPPA